MFRNYLLVLCTGLLLVGLPPTRAGAATTHDFLILYSNDVHGETEPCG